MTGRVLAEGDGGGSGLKFEARKSVVPPASTTLRTQMDQQGSSVELRNLQNELLLKLDGNELDDLYRNNKIDVRNKERFKQSIYDLWAEQRPEPTDPGNFVLDLTDVQSADQLMGRLKMLMDWLEQHLENDVSVQRQQMQQSAAPGEPRTVEPGTGPVQPQTGTPPPPAQPAPQQQPQQPQQPAPEQPQQSPEDEQSEEKEPADEEEPEAGPAA